MKQYGIIPKLIDPIVPQYIKPVHQFLLILLIGWGNLRLKASASGDNTQVSEHAVTSCLSSDFLIYFSNLDLFIKFQTLLSEMSDKSAAGFLVIIIGLGLGFEFTCVEDLSAQKLFRSFKIGPSPSPFKMVLQGDPQFNKFTF